MRFSRVMGIIFCVLGVLGFIAIVSSFDYGDYFYMRVYPTIYSDEIAIMSQELIATWVEGITVLIINVGVGVLLITLDLILGELIKIRKGDANIKTDKKDGDSATSGSSTV